jgi:hypothetical protein
VHQGHTHSACGIDVGLPTPVAGNHKKVDSIQVVAPVPADYYIVETVVGLEGASSLVAKSGVYHNNYRTVPHTLPEIDIQDIEIVARQRKYHNNYRTDPHTLQEIDIQDIEIVARQRKYHNNYRTDPHTLQEIDIQGTEIVAASYSLRYVKAESLFLLYTSSPVFKLSLSSS